MICAKYFPEPNLKDIRNNFSSDLTYGICKSCFIQYPVEKTLKDFEEKV